ncbi:hypothetical protein BDN72DRAFT_110965 [Pluteus cervinus]|uniref:Uncharacterized protein n=1 Tax=Pluteus cervinus TaxID=181527 RepID=A0ACD3AQQ7_9AGAR|nr:hypothetical protein BDN72DRAFT_110965 [Pluteus cervinus]
MSQKPTSSPNHPLASIHNFRDLSHVSARLRPGLLFRSAHLDSPSPSDLQYLIQTLKVHTILDLRSPSLERRPSLPADTATTINVPLITSNLEKAWLFSLRWWWIIWFFVLALVGKKKEMLQLIAREVLAPRGLVGTMIDSFDVASERIIQVLDVLVEEKAYPVVMHCQFGKDRTGAMSIVILRILGASWEEVEKDYVVLGTKEWKAMVRDDNLRMGLGEDFDEAPVEVVRGIRAWFERRGGVEAWCNQNGFGAEKQQKLREILLKDNHTAEKEGNLNGVGIEVHVNTVNQTGLQKRGTKVKR